MSRPATRLWSAATALLVACLLTCGVAVATADARSTGADLRDSLTRVMKATDGPPGIAGLIVRDGRRQFFWRGNGNVQTATAPKLRRPFRIASVSKAYNGAVALSLVRKGKLKLSDTIGKLLPNQLPKARRVTLTQLLQHTGGVADYIKDEAFREKLAADPARYMSPRRLLSFVSDKPLNFRPGSGYSYSDTDNIVVGLMAEKVTGASYEKLLRREVGRRTRFGPTRLPRNLFKPTPFLHGYEIEQGEPAQDVSN